MLGEYAIHKMVKVI